MYKYLYEIRFTGINKLDFCFKFISELLWNAYSRVRLTDAGSRRHSNELQFTIRLLDR